MLDKKIYAIFIAILFLLSGCGKNDEEITTLSEENVPQVESNKPTGTVNASVAENLDTVSISMRPPQTLNPILNNDETVDKVLSLIFKPLFQIDTVQRVVPAVAKNYVLSDDGLTLTIYLNEDIYFEDGKKLTAEDVVFTLDSIKNAESSYYKSTLSGISDYLALDSKTVVIKYSSPIGSCMYNLCFPIIPKHYYKDKMTLLSDVNMKPLGDGEFKFSSYRVVREMYLVRNKETLKAGEIKNVKVIISPDNETDIDLFEQGITDAICVSASEWGKLNTKRDANAFSASVNNFEFLGFNLKSPVMQNLNFRKAVACAVASNEIADNIYLGNAEKCLTPIHPKSWLYCTETKITYEYSLEQAGKYLEDSKLTPQQLKFNLIVNSENNERNETAKIIATSLNQLGMEVNVVPMAYEKYIETLNSDNFDMFIGGASLSPVPDLSCLLSSMSQNISGINYFNYSDAKMDTFLSDAINSIGETNYKLAMDSVQKQFYEQLPCIGIVFKNSILVVDSKIKNCTDFMPYNYLSNISNWSISKK